MKDTPRSLTFEELEKHIRSNVAQECYLQCLAVECGEGEAARAIATKFPDLITRIKED